MPANRPNSLTSRTSRGPSIALADGPSKTRLVEGLREVGAIIEPSEVRELRDPVCAGVFKHLDSICATLAECRRDMLTEHPRDGHRAGLLAEALIELSRVKRAIVNLQVEDH